MRFTKSHWPAAVSTAIFALLCTAAQAEPPGYGGTLHVKVRAASISLDPREWTLGSLSSGASDNLAGVVYERLVTLDDHARFQPGVAAEWVQDAAVRNWQFKLRPSVRFSDGSLLTSADVVASLQSSLGKEFEVSATENGVAIRAAHPAPDLLEQLASGAHFIFRKKADGTLLGTGPFFVVDSVPAAPSEANPMAIKPLKIKFQQMRDPGRGVPSSI